jgi:hypothetical protein
MGIPNLPIIIEFDEAERGENGITQAPHRPH